MYQKVDFALNNFGFGKQFLLVLLKNVDFRIGPMQKAH